MQHFRIVTYNTHRSRGIDGRARPGRIAEVLSEIGADIVALQEVLSRAGASREFDQARYIAESLRLHWVMGVNRTYRGGLYGNVVLSRFPIRMMRNHDLSLIGREERGCLRADIDLGLRILHVFNVHLGTAVEERRYQGEKLITADLLNDVELSAPRIVLGDFNEWTRGVATRLLSSELVSADVEAHLQHTRTYPGLLPVLHLDHIYYDPGLKLERLLLHRSRKALIASDHLPLVADFEVPAKWSENKNGSK
jgi:endonuclease/exonuclease/phosphatase family metal-dependent hydrolase